jgi:cell division protein FtsZ
MAISSPLLEASIDGAHGVLLSIQGGSDLGLFEINEAAQLVSNSAAVDANIIFGAVIDDALGDEVRVTVIAAGFDETRAGRGPATATVGAGASGSSGTASGASGGGASGAGASGAGASGAGASGFGGTASAGGGAASGSGGSSGSGASSWGGPSGETASFGSASFGSGGGSSADGSSVGGSSAGGSSVGGSGADQTPASAGGDGGAGAAPSTWTPAPTPAPAPAPASGFPGGFSGFGRGSRPGGGAPDRSAAEAAREPVAEVPAQPATEAGGGYVPAPVAFVSDEDGDEDSGRPGFSSSDTRDDLPRPTTWKDSARDHSSRRRQVVFEEDDDLDVPDFLK